MLALVVANKSKCINTSSSSVKFSTAGKANVMLDRGNNLTNSTGKMPNQFDCSSNA